MIQEEQLIRVVELIKNGISKEDFEFFVNNANPYSTEVKSSYGNSLHKDEWEDYFKSHRISNSFNKLKIELIFNYLKDFHRDSFRIIPNNIFAFDKNFPNNYNFNEEIQIFRTIELFTT